MGCTTRSSQTSETLDSILLARNSNLNLRLVWTLAGRGVCYLSLFVFASSAAIAHPGHGSSQSADNGHSVVHYLTDPFHAVGIFGSIVAIFAGVYVAANALSRSRSGVAATSRRLETSGHARD
jgi:hypothetical protein